MRFWQAMIMAEMAAGAVYADRVQSPWWQHWALDVGNIILGAVMWIIFKRLYPTTPGMREEEG